ncbi:MAG: DUF5110 domain-containing protein, partial [Anaerolineaceae bacterium]|nr:DUF5110 domain-containing protein [Anaerolineaceae bacterium]
QTIWLPEGDWYHFFTGQSFKGGRFITLHGDLEDIPVFAPAGAIIPLDANAGWGAGISNPMNLELQIFAGGNHSFTLFEDDGVSNGYQHNQYSLTTFEQKYARNELNFIIHPAEGDLSHLDDTRGFSLNFFGVTNPEQIKVTLSGTELPIQHVYDAEMECLIIPDIEMSPTDKVIVTLTGDNLLSRRDRRPEQIRKLLKSALINTWVKNEIDQKIDLLLTDPKWADIASNYLKPAQVKALQDILKY